MSQALADQIRATAATERIPIGRLLLEAGAISVRNLMRVMTMQQDVPGLRFGEIAIREGFVDARQLEAALVRQETARLHQVEVVRRVGALSSGELAKLVVEYVTFLEDSLNEPRDEPGAVGSGMNGTR